MILYVITHQADGGGSLFVGAYSTRKEAEATAETLRFAGLGDATVEEHLTNKVDKSYQFYLDYAEKMVGKDQ